MITKLITNKSNHTNKSIQAWIVVKVVVAIIVITLFFSSLYLANYFINNIYKPENKVIKELKSRSHNRWHKDTARPDPGLIRYERAIELIKNNDIINAKNELTQVVNFYQKSISYNLSKRLLGEINLDLLYTSNKIPKKKYYTVKPGDSISIIIKKLASEAEGKIKMSSRFLMAINNLMSSRLTPNQRLITYPLNFNAEINISKKTFTIFDNNIFFKEYRILNSKLPNKMKLPLTITIDVSKYITKGKGVTQFSRHYNSANKILINQNWGFIIFGNVNVENKDTNYSNDYNLDKLYGIEVRHEDMEELAMLLLAKTKIKILK